MDLEELMQEIVIGRPTKGRPPAMLELQVVRELNAGDKDMLENPPANGLPTPMLQKLRASHHMLARLLAEGRRDVEVAMVTGYSQVRIGVLKHDPAFQELVAYYAGQTEVRYLDLHSRLATLGADTVEVLQERVDEEPEKFTTNELLKIAEMALDRSGKVASPASKAGSTINIVFKQPTAAPDGVVIDGTAQVLDDPEPSGQVLDLDP